MQNKDYQKLRECPFCGGEAVLTQGTFNNKISKVICKHCLASTKIFHTPYGAIAAWNTRTNTIPVGNGKDYTVVNE